ncbi:MAG TPA: hypothetical protein VJB16_02480, partial [archaeon]|nr:hypothetical protein [archaeon]
METSTGSFDFQVHVPNRVFQLRSPDAQAHNVWVSFFREAHRNPNGTKPELKRHESTSRINTSSPLSSPAIVRAADTSQISSVRPAAPTMSAISNTPPLAASGAALVANGAPLAASPGDSAEDLPAGGAPDEMSDSQHRMQVDLPDLGEDATARRKQVEDMRQNLESKKTERDQKKKEREDKFKRERDRLRDERLKFLEEENSRLEEEKLRRIEQERVAEEQFQERMRQVEQRLAAEKTQLLDERRRLEEDYRRKIDEREQQFREQEQRLAEKRRLMNSELLKRREEIES